MQRYYRFVKNKTQTEMYPTNVNPYTFTDYKNEFYTSAFTYSEDQYQQFLKTKSCKGFDNALAKKIWFDLDCKENLQIALDETKELCKILNDYNIKYRVCFSGSKGFSVDFGVQEFWTVEEIKTFCLGIGVDLMTLDVDTLYQNQTLFRLPLTKNPKGGYKIPLSQEQLETFTIDQIKTLSNDLEYVKNIKASGLIPNKVDKEYFMEQFKGLKNSFIKRRVKSITERISKVDTKLEELDFTAIEFSRNRANIPACKFALEQGYFGSGQRNHALMILCSTYKAQGFQKQLVYRMLKGVAQTQAELFQCDRFPDEEIWNNIVEVVFNPGWKGGTYTPDTSPLLAYIDSRLPPGQRFKISELDQTLCTIEEDEKEFDHYANNFEKNTIKTGIASIDENVHIGIGMSVGLVGAPGSAKTSLAIEILENVAQTGQKCLFVCLDMSRQQIYGKKIARNTGWGLKTIITKKKHEPELYAKAKKEMNDKWKNVITTYKSFISVDEIKQMVESYNNKHSDKIRFIVIDYLECLGGSTSDDLLDQKRIAFKLRDLANQGYCVLTLLQPNKAGGNPSKPLLDYNSIKGSGAISQSMRLVLSVSRPGYGARSQYDKFISISAIKNNLGPLFAVDLSWDGVRGRVAELTYEQRKELEDLQKRLKEEEAQKEGSPW